MVAEPTATIATPSVGLVSSGTMRYTDNIGGSLILAPEGLALSITGASLPVAVLEGAQFTLSDDADKAINFQATKTCF